MASVTLDTLWLNDLENMSDAMSFPTMSALVATVEDRAEVRMYANGRTRLIRRVGKPRGAKVRLPLLPRDKVLWLEWHSGRMLLVRDPQGRKFYGTFFSPSFDEIGFLNEAGTELTFVEVSHSEAV